MGVSSLRNATNTTFKEITAEPEKETLLWGQETNSSSTIDGSFRGARRSRATEERKAHHDDDVTCNDQWCAYDLVRTYSQNCLGCWLLWCCVGAICKS